MKFPYPRIAKRALDLRIEYLEKELDRLNEESNFFASEGFEVIALRYDKKAEKVATELIELRKERRSLSIT